jgi:ATP-binding protein involved in chromosome partitioning
MLGVADARPTQVEDMIMPVPTASGVSVISIGMLKPRRDQVVAWRGPMLDRALVQMLSDVFWGDLDVLLLDSRRAPATSPSRWASTSPTPRWSW